MTDLPLLMSAPMVRATLAELKTMTRRVLRPHPEGVSQQGAALFYFNHPRYAVGDRLWVREAHYMTDDGDNEYPVFAEDSEAVRQHLDHVATMTNITENVKQRHTKLRPAIHMPRWASRLTLFVTGVKVERLQDISIADAVAEGIEPENSHGLMCQGYVLYDKPGWGTRAPVDSFKSLWQSINAKRAPWDANPWVVAIAFKAHKINIDRMTV